jgi:Recombinase
VTRSPRRKGRARGWAGNLRLATTSRNANSSSMKRKRRPCAISFDAILNSGPCALCGNDLATAGVVSKRRIAADGSAYGGQRFSRDALYLMLKNRLYRGKIVHKGIALPGEHGAIVDEELWGRVQNHIEVNRIARREGDKALVPSPLAGIVFDASSEAMTPTHAVKMGTRYRYYISRRLITGPAADCSQGQRIPASNRSSCHQPPAGSPLGSRNPIVHPL